MYFGVDSSMRAIACEVDASAASKVHQYNHLKEFRMVRTTSREQLSLLSSSSSLGLRPGGTNKTLLLE